MRIDAIICRGHQHASGIAEDASHEGGNLRLQEPCFRAQGFDLREHLGGDFHWGTLKCYIGKQNVDPLTYTKATYKNRDTLTEDVQIDPLATKWDAKITNVTWHLDEEKENFFFLHGRIHFNNATYPCCIYFPNPIGKPDDFHLPAILEILAPPLPFKDGQVYGQQVTLEFPDGKLALIAAPQPGSPSPRAAHAPRSPGAE